MPHSVLRTVGLRQGPITWDEMRFDPCGLFRLQGWSFLESDEIPTPELMLNSEALPLLNRWRYWRPDLWLHNESKTKPWAGFAFEWLAPDGLARAVTLKIKGAKPRVILAGIEVVRSSHIFLLNGSEVAGREQIYGSGLPCQTVDDQIRALMPFMTGRLLDFGCGAGALVRELRKNGKEAFGIEIDRPVITENLIPEVAPYLKLYGGGPLPFESNAFDCVTAFEVIEHVADYKFALEEISRVASRLVMSVPDMATIPILHQHNVVPWHLLESTHLNFFTEISLRRALEPHFKKIEIGRMGEIETNGTRYFISLVAVCDK